MDTNFAIVDIETTGGSAAQSGITEIAVLLFDAQTRTITHRFETLINPEMPVPYYITTLTGIDNRMVADAPVFADIAPQLFKLLHNRVFVAHNVNFDYSFINHQFKKAGIAWSAKKLCSVRYACKVLPGMPSYSLGNLCRQLNLPIENRHRAAGDASATAVLLMHLMQADDQLKHLSAMLKGRNPHSYLPLHVPESMFENLPYCAGVYYFKDEKGKVLYVGKARNIKYRVRSHFSNNEINPKKQELLRRVHSITYRPCVTELMALVWESAEIKRLWPEFNRSQKFAEPGYGLYQLLLQNGREILVVERKKSNLRPLYQFTQPTDGLQMVRMLARQHGVDAALALGGTLPPNISIATANLATYRLAEVLRSFLPSFLLKETGEDEAGRPREVYYCIKKGMLCGFAVMEPLVVPDSANVLENLELVQDNSLARYLIMQKAIANKEALLLID